MIERGMAGIRSIGWWLPEGRRAVQDVVRDFRLHEDALAATGLKSKAVAGEDDHPSTMGARATMAALDAAGLGVEDLDLLIFTGTTRDWPSPWVAAFGVLHELGSKRAAGFDLSNRCAGTIDALWLAKLLVEAGTHQNVAVCCANAFDHVLGPQRRAEVPTDALFSAGAATALVSGTAGNDIVGFSSLSYPSLSLHKSGGPLAGGSRQALDEGGMRENLHHWRHQLRMRDIDEIARFHADADRHNFPELFRQMGTQSVDFVACSPFYPEPQLASFQEMGIGRESTLFTIPFVGHIGGADLFLTLGVAIASGRRVGPRVIFSMRNTIYANALAIRGSGDGPGIAVSGQGVDLDLWRVETPTRG